MKETVSERESAFFRAHNKYFHIFSPSVTQTVLRWLPPVLDYHWNISLRACLLWRPCRIYVERLFNDPSIFYICMLISKKHATETHWIYQCVCVCVININNSKIAHKFSGVHKKKNYTAFSKARVWNLFVYTHQDLCILNDMVHLYLPPFTKCASYCN